MAMDDMIETGQSPAQDGRPGIMSTKILPLLGAALRNSYEDVFQADVPASLQRLMEEFKDKERDAMHASRR